jgi:hypothetical protein
MLNPDEKHVVRWPWGQKPLLMVVVDTEAEFDWLGDSRQALGVRSASHQQRAQKIYDRFNVRPTYALDYPVSSNRDGYEPIREIYESGGCLIGTHLQPWDTPPLTEFLSDLNSFPGNLPSDLESAKLASLTNTIEMNLKVRPRIYKAGRYGVGAGTANILQRLGYEIDVSVQPGTNLSHNFGPDFSRCHVNPYWFGGTPRLFEIPLSIGYAGLLGRYGNRLRKFLGRPRIEALHFPGLFARLGLLERITLTPEGVTLDEQKRLARAMLRRGQRVFHLTYHSPSLLPGSTPYVNTERDLGKFLDRIRGFLEFFFGEFGGIPATPFEVREAALKAEPMASNFGVGQVYEKSRDHIAALGSKRSE